MVTAWGSVRQPASAVDDALAPYKEIARRHQLQLETLLAHRPMVTNRHGRTEKAKFCIPDAAAPAVRPLLRSALWAPAAYDNLGLKTNEELYVGMVAGRFIFVPSNKPDFFTDVVDAIGAHRVRYAAIERPAHYAAHALQAEESLITT